MSDLIWVGNMLVERWVALSAAGVIALILIGWFIILTDKPLT